MNVERRYYTGVERGSARRSFLKGRESAIVNQTNTGTVSKATLGKRLRDGVERIIMGFSERLDTILNWTELNVGYRLTHLLRLFDGHDQLSLRPLLSTRTGDSYKIILSKVAYNNHRIWTQLVWLSKEECRWSHDDDDVELHVLGCRLNVLGTNCDHCLSMVQCCSTSTETIRLIRTGSPGRPPRLSHSSWTLTSLPH